MKHHLPKLICSFILIPIQVFAIPIASSEIFCDLSSIKIDLEFNGMPGATGKITDKWLYTEIDSLSEYISNYSEEYGTISTNRQGISSLTQLSEDVILNQSSIKNGNRWSYSAANIHYAFYFENLTSITVSLDCDADLHLRSSLNETAYGAFKADVNLRDDSYDYRDHEELKFYHRAVNDNFDIDTSKHLSLSLDFNDIPFSGKLNLYILSYAMVYTEVPVPEPEFAVFIFIGFSIFLLIFQKKITWYFFKF